jgi:hypothetical protein
MIKEGMYLLKSIIYHILDVDIGDAIGLLFAMQ